MRQTINPTGVMHCRYRVYEVVPFIGYLYVKWSMESTEILAFGLGREYNVYGLAPQIYHT